MVPSFYNREIETQEVDLTTADNPNCNGVRIKIQISELSESLNKVSVQLHHNQFFRKKKTHTSDLKEKPFPAYKTLGFEGLHRVGNTGNSVLFPRCSLPQWGKNSLGPITSTLARL